MLKRLACLTVILLLAACVQGPTRQQVLASLIGQPEADVVRILGVPSRTITVGGRTFLAFTEQRTRVLPAAGYYGGFGFWGGAYGFGGFPPEVITWTCETTVEIADGRMASFSLRGNAC